jgi:hypothetical protein
MRTHCAKGREKTPENIFYVRGKRGYWKCRTCRAAERRRARKKKIDSGRWWEAYSKKSLSITELKMLARGLAHGQTIGSITRGASPYYATSLYRRWLVWKNHQPEMAARFNKLSRQAFREIGRNSRNQYLANLSLTTLVTRPIPPAEMIIAMIDEAVAPLRIMGTLRMEICQGLVVEVLERRIECTVESLRRCAIIHKSKFFRRECYSLDAMIGGGVTTWLDMKSDEDRLWP